MRVLLTCLLLVNGVSFADTIHDSYAIYLLSRRSDAAIEVRPTRGDNYKVVMVRHSTVVSKNLSFLSLRVRLPEGSKDPENGSPGDRVRLSSYPPDRDLHPASEPSSLAMLGTGLLGLALLVKRRIKAQSASPL